MRVLFVISLFIFSLSAFCQKADSTKLTPGQVNTPDEKPELDYVLTFHKGLMKGKILAEDSVKYLRLQVNDSTIREIPFNEIRRIRYGSQTTGASVASPRYREPSSLPYRDQKLGAGLLTTGVILTLAGTVMIIVNPANVGTYRNSSNAGIVFHNVAAVGLAFDLAGIPMLIVGAVKLARANKYKRIIGGKEEE